MSNRISYKKLIFSKVEEPTSHGYMFSVINLLSGLFDIKWSCLVSEANLLSDYVSKFCRQNTKPSFHARVKRVITRVLGKKRAFDGNNLWLHSISSMMYHFIFFNIRWTTRTTWCAVLCVKQNALYRGCVFDVLYNMWQRIHEKNKLRAQISVCWYVLIKSAAILPIFCFLCFLLSNFLWNCKKFKISCYFKIIV